MRAVVDQPSVSIAIDRATMATRIKNGYVPHKAIDSLILKSLEEKLEIQLRQAYSDIEYVHDELKALSVGKGLPKAYQAAYARLRDVATPVLRAIAQARKKRTGEWWRFKRVKLDMPPPAWIVRAKQVVAQINALDLELEASLRKARDVLLNGQPDAIFDWNMPASVEVTLTLNHGPKRSIYDHIDQTYVGCVFR